MAVFESLERARPMSVRIAEHVVERIQSGEFPVGMRLPSETELARQFGVSRPSVREALGALQFVGYVDSVRGSGSRVVSQRPQVDGPRKSDEIGPREVLRFFEARLLSEPQVAALAARDPDLDRLAEAEKLIEAMELVAHEPALHGETDLSVHRALAQACRNSFMVEPVLRLLDVLASPALRATRRHAWADHDLPPLWHDHHRETLEAIRAGRPQAAAESTWRHLESSARHALEVVAREGTVDERARSEFTSFLSAGPYASALATHDGSEAPARAHADERRSRVRPLAD
ncbi:MAG TPA: FCD domain-containing protein [Ornithinimicrobium sp.]|uniref:FadR/GntR family transcriptional regulator n=1 Tax=Ornithinimicrobium sp. TaxID=1977084 RepID=UPI002B46005A|nr:FCD domain-containing protein [Ornithinimicrobium sp.]HKJ12799.1 FCD domain-containing protein [Ornithinimicrobium sp.]